MCLGYNNPGIRSCRSDRDCYGNDKHNNRSERPVDAALAEVITDQKVRKD